MLAMSRVEFDALVEKVTGIPTPAPDAPEEIWDQWEVAAAFLIRGHDNPRDLDSMRVAAVNALLSDNPEAGKRRRLKPHIERALGRQLTPEEFAAGHISQAMLEGAESVGLSGDIRPNAPAGDVQLADMLT